MDDNTTLDGGYDIATPHITSIEPKAHQSKQEAPHTTRYKTTGTTIPPQFKQQQKNQKQNSTSLNNLLLGKMSSVGGNAAGLSE